jgi:hypothetical protein
VSPLVAGETQITVGYGVEDDLNTYRPEAGQCRGCVFGTGGEYNQTFHTQPTYLISGLLTIYE